MNIKHQYLLLRKGSTFLLWCKKGGGCNWFSPSAMSGVTKGSSQETHWSRIRLFLVLLLGASVAKIHLPYPSIFYIYLVSIHYIMCARHITTPDNLTWLGLTRHDQWRACKTRKESNFEKWRGVFLRISFLASSVLFFVLCVRITSQHHKTWP